MNEQKSSKWYELEIGWKWPHQGFTLGYDIYQPHEPNEDEPNEAGGIYYIIVLYLGPLSLIYTWGDFNWE